MLLFCDGFDHYVAGNSHPLKWDVFQSFDYGGNPANPDNILIGTSYGRTSLTDSFTGGLKMFPQQGNSGFGGPGPSTCRITKFFGANAQTYILGFAFYWFNTSTFGSVDACDHIVASFYDSGTAQVDLRMNSSGYFYFTRNGTVIGSLSSLPLTSVTWRYLEIRVTIDPSVGVCELRVDGVPWITLAGQNTKNSSNSTMNAIQLGFTQNAGGNGGFPSTVAWDDLYLCDTSGSVNNNYLGDVRIRTALPSGNSATQAWTAAAATFPVSTALVVGTTIFDGTNLQRVQSISGTGTTGSSAPTWSGTLGVTTTSNPGANQVVFVCLGTPTQYNYVNEQSPDGDFSYISDNTVNDISQFTYPSIAGSTVFAVAVQADARKDDAGTRGIRAVAKTGTTTIDNGVDLMLSSTPTIQSGIFETDPTTGVAWTVSGVNSAEFGVKVSV